MVPGRRALTLTTCPAPKAKALRKAKAKALRKAKVMALRKAKTEVPRKAKVKALRKAEAEALHKAKVKALRKADAEALHKAKVMAIRKAKADPPQGKRQGPPQGKGGGPPQGKGQGHVASKGQGRGPAQDKHSGPPQAKGQGPPPSKGDGAPQAKEKARTFGETLTHMDYIDYMDNIDTNATERFTTRWADGDTYVQKASLVHTLHESAAARKWAWVQGAVRYPWFEKEQRQKQDKNGNMVIIREWVAEIEVWGNYDLTHGDFIHGWDINRTDFGDHIAPPPDFIGKVHGDGTCGTMVTIVCSNELPIVSEQKYWCCVLPR